MESGITVFARDRKGLLHDISGIITKHGANIVFIQQFILKDEVQIYFELMEVEDLDNLKTDIIKVASVASVDNYRPFEQIYGKRVIVIGGGAQVAQVVLGAVSEADRHNLRGERISVDTIPLVGETILAEAVRAVGRLHRAAVLVLAGSLMGGEVTKAIRELREDYNIPIISLNMAGSVPKECDLIVSDPVQAGAMAVMHIAETAKFNIKKLQQKKF